MGFDKLYGNAVLTEEFEDGRSRNINAVRDITQQWVEKQMGGRESEFTGTPVAGTIFCGTWNVNAKKQESSLRCWLMPTNSTPSIDIYAIGFQEIVDLNASNVLLDGSKTVERAKFWQNKIEECLPQNGNYKLVMSKALVGLLLCVYVSNRIIPYVKDVRATHQPTGIMGVMGNKGGVCVRLSVHDTSLCFVCAHLAAHRENVVGRNADFKTIIDGATFDRVETDDAEVSVKAGGGDAVMRPLRGAALSMTRDLDLMGDHELLFWLGDLNYRIADSMTTEDVFARIEAGDLASLWEVDQLAIEMEKGTAFQGFSEGQLAFRPTYKYQPGTNAYDRRPDKKIRTPAWCDRVLWRSTLSDDMYPVRLCFYQSADLLPSDHKPVSALFTVKFRDRIEKVCMHAFGVNSCSLIILHV